jgi:hypothetical protein
LVIVPLLPFFFLLLLFGATTVHSSSVGRGVGGHIVRVVGWCCLGLTPFPGCSGGSFVAVAGAEWAEGSVDGGMDSLLRASSLETMGLITTLIMAAMSVSVTVPLGPSMSTSCLGFYCRE